jgi:hypothetical protein
MPTQSPIQWVQGSFYSGVKRPGREADHPPPASAEVKNGATMLLHRPISFHGMVFN